MPKFAETFSEEQRAAVVADALAIGNNREAWRRAREGRLTAGLEPFTIGYTYVCELVNEEKERRDPEGTAARGKTAAELADDVLRRELRRLDSASRANRLNPQRAREMVRMLRELAPIANRAAASNGNGDQAPEQGDSEPEQPRGILEQLADAEREVAATTPEHDDAQGTGDGEGNSGDAGSSVDQGETFTEHDSGESESAISTRAANLAKLAGSV